MSARPRRPARKPRRRHRREGRTVPPFSRLVRSSLGKPNRHPGRAAHALKASGARLSRALAMSTTRGEGAATPAGDRYRALLAVSQAIVGNRDLAALFHDMAGRLRQVVGFDYLALVLHDAATGAMRLHV